MCDLAVGLFGQAVWPGGELVAVGHPSVPLHSHSLLGTAVSKTLLCSLLWAGSVTSEVAGCACL